MIKTDYLRISVTDRCNLRCVYCHPLGGCDYINRHEVLSLEEISRIVRLFVRCGIRKVRLTGGEPLVRNNITNLIIELASIPGIQELTMTTNGIKLASTAEELKEAGLQRVNISLDSAESENYRKLTGFDSLPAVLAGIDQAINVGLEPVKINSVILKGLNETQIIPLVSMIFKHPVVVRFIEYYPTSQYTVSPDDYVPNHDVKRIIEKHYGPLMPMPKNKKDGPATNFKLSNAIGTIGFINGRSSMFCSDCNRIRLTSDGLVKPCLYSSYAYDIKKMIRNGTEDTILLNKLKEILQEKGSYTKTTKVNKEFHMQKVGG